jgi:hypothetical protein
MQIDFDPTLHTYRVSGMVKPSVTQVLDAMGYVSPFCKSGTAASRGSEIHSLLENKDKGLPMQQELDDISKSYLTQYEQYIIDVQPTFTDIELLMYDEQLEVCGTVDRAGIRPDFIMDIKTGTSVPESARLQTAAYAMMRFPLTYETVKRYCLHINPKRKSYAIKTYDDINDFIEWENTCKLYWNNLESMMY